MIEAISESLDKAGIDERPGKLLADASYASEENFAALGPDDPDSYVAVRNMRKNPTRRTGRRGPLRRNATFLDKMDPKVSNNSGRDLYKRRQAIIEPIFGQIKDVRKIRSFMRKGKSAADSE
nr:transposase [Acidimicrobium ferrooxidans]